MINALIVGSSQGIGLGCVQKLLTDDNVNHIYATYRQEQSAGELIALAQEHDKLTCIPVDVTQESQIATLVEKIQNKTPQLHLVINCVGILHDDTVQPEKSLKQINNENLLRYFQTNSIPTVLLAKHLIPLFRHRDRSVFATISAKLASIGDNRLGGWYGYRASKTALNMFVRNIAIEYSRTCPQTLVVTLHPGTTDTRLSRPFQKNVPPEKLFSVQRTVEQLLQVIAKLQDGDSGEFFSWDGSKLPW